MAVTKGNGCVEWETPPNLWKLLNDRHAFTLDGAASQANALCDTFCTEDGTFRLIGGAIIIQISELDGLSYPWFGHRVFVNPPYERELIKAFTFKMMEERNDAWLISALLPASTDTRWFHQHVLPYAHIDWLPRRVRFWHPKFKCGEDCEHELGGPVGSPPTGHVIATYKNTEALADALKI